MGGRGAALSAALDEQNVVSRALDDQYVDPPRRRYAYFAGAHQAPRIRWIFAGRFKHFILYGRRTVSARRPRPALAHALSQPTHLSSLYTLSRSRSDARADILPCVRCVCPVCPALSHAQACRFSRYNTTPPSTTCIITPLRRSTCQSPPFAPRSSPQTPRPRSSPPAASYPTACRGSAAGPPAGSRR